MMKAAEAERLSGHKVGGISPFRRVRALKTAIEEQAMAHGLVFIIGGQRGLHVQLDGELQGSYTCRAISE
jgi:Cys-tRNA(Pro)/Cys-tRNA(Cys) deacylase